MTTAGSPSHQRWIVLGGGVGPMAGLALHQAIIQQTPTDGRDQSHLSVLHISVPRQVPDRTEFLLGMVEENPGVPMARLVAAAVRQVPPEGLPALVGVPCNTFHAPEIVAAFSDELHRQLPHPLHEQLEFVHMVNATVAHVAHVAHAADARPRKVGVLSTTGTRSVGLYERALAAAGLDILQVPEEEQRHLHEAIYNLQWGLKAVSPPDPRAVRCVEHYAAMLTDARADALILACTELPLALTTRQFRGVPVIDPVQVLATQLVFPEQSAHP